VIRLRPTSQRGDESVRKGRTNARTHATVKRENLKPRTRRPLRDSPRFILAVDNWFFSEQAQEKVR